MIEYIFSGIFALILMCIGALIVTLAFVYISPVVALKVMAVVGWVTFLMGTA